MRDLPEDFPTRYGTTVTKESNGRLKIDPRLLVSIAGWLVSIMLAWGYVNTKLAVVESKVERLQQDMTDMRGDIRTLLGRP